eukprot:760837-Hanusia_phi.AAC.1
MRRSARGRGAGEEACDVCVWMTSWGCRMLSRSTSQRKIRNKHLDEENKLQREKSMLEAKLNEMDKEMTQLRKFLSNEQTSHDTHRHDGCKLARRLKFSQERVGGGARKADEDERKLAGEM